MWYSSNGPNLPSKPAKKRINVERFHLNISSHSICLRQKFTECGLSDNRYLQVTLWGSMFPMTLFYLKLSHKCLPRPTDCLNYEKKEDITTYFQRVINTLKII